MPLRNGTGPMGNGPATGWGRGGCAGDPATRGIDARGFGGGARGGRGFGRGASIRGGRGFGRGAAFGGGYGRGFAANGSYAAGGESTWTLEDEKKALEERLKTVQAMMEETEK